MAQTPRKVTENVPMVSVSVPSQKPALADLTDI